MSAVYFGAAILFRLRFFCVSSNLRTTTWHLVVLQISVDADFTASEKMVRPAARSTASTAGDIPSVAEVKNKNKNKKVTRHCEALQRCFIGYDSVRKNEGPRGKFEDVRSRRWRQFRCQHDFRKVSGHRDIWRRPNDFMSLHNIKPWKGRL